MYGSPVSYNVTTNTPAGYYPIITGLIGVGNDGAELRLRKSDLQALLNINPSVADARNLALDYQKVYNGSGIFLPRKIDFGSGLTFTPGTSGQIGTGSLAATVYQSTLTGNQNAYLFLTNPEIAAQIAFMNVPSKLMPFAPTNYPTFPPMSPSSTWTQLFSNPYGTPPSNCSYWLPLFPMNYTEFDAYTPTPGRGLFTRLMTAAGNRIDPERFTYVDGTGSWPQLTGDHWFGADEDYDYPDINNMFLAMERGMERFSFPHFIGPASSLRSRMGSTR